MAAHQGGAKTSQPSAHAGLPMGPHKYINRDQTNGAPKTGPTGFFFFELTSEAAEKNFLILKQHNMDLEIALHKETPH
jgi:hypothetical protein